MFFTSWKLWEQMTFVLGTAILIVFAIGYGKLLRTNRIIKKQELVDEEKRMKIQELRNSGQIVESRRSHDIPFGVRAIQSGIQVDGIWISQTPTPVPSELKLGHLRTSSTDLLATVDSSIAAQASMDRPHEVVRPSSRQARSTFQQDDMPGLAMDKVLEASIDRPNSAGTRMSYKPRRSSHLRQGSHGLYDEDTLDQLEGRPMSRASKAKVRSHRPRGSRHFDTEPESSAADNEQSSEPSSDSEASLSHQIDAPAAISSGSFTAETPHLESPLLGVANKGSGKSVIVPKPLHSAKAEYFSISLDSPGREASDPFITPLASPLASPPESGSDIQPSSSSIHQGVPPRSSSPFVPGELHANKTVRKVNSGFEVLPAGTFGVPNEFKGKGVDTDYDEDSGERRQSKLQKKNRVSTSGRRPSMTTDRP